MGGGASSGGVEGLLATTLMVGRAIAGVYRNPGMYRIQDFHSEKAPRLKSAAKVNFAFFGQEDSDNEDDEDDYEPPSPIEYEHMFSVEVSDETIYIEDVCFINEEGWTALHSCCMSFVTVPAALKIIDEVRRMGGSIDVKTTSGPGSFNKGWTPLQMASAYGVEPVVEKLISQGADVNSANCYGYTSLLEACHRGYLGVIEKLVKAGADLTYIPDAQQSYASPFQAAPPHCALGESARCGYVRIVTLLLESENSPDKDQVNYLGWTPLHEACFYNRVDVVAALLKAGCKTNIRTKSGALAWHLSGLENIRQMLKEEGGPGTEPDETDTINMIEILQEVTSGISSADRKEEEDMVLNTMNHQMGGQMGQMHLENGDNGDEEDALFEMLKSSMGDFEDNMDDADERMASMQAELFELETQRRDLEADIRQAKEDEEEEARRAGDAKGLSTPSPKKALSLGNDNPLLHSGPMLGNLPQIGTRRSPSDARENAARDIDDALKLGEPERGVLTNQELGRNKGPSAKAAGKDIKKKKKKTAPEIPKDMPQKFICHLSQQPMQQPVKSSYGHFFEKAVIGNWIEQQGRICPITGAPLSENDLVAQDDLQQEIVMWMLKKSSAPALELVQDDAAASIGKSVNNQEDVPEAAGTKDDLYDF